MKYSFYINGIDCAHCSENLLNEVKKISGVEKANFNFTTKKFVFYSDSPAIKEKVLSLLNKLEPKATISEKAENNEKNEKYILFIRIALTVLLLLSTFVISNNIVKIILSYSAYFIIGYTVIFDTFNAIKNKNFFDEKFLMTVASLGAMAIGEYTEAIAVMLLFNFGEYFQDRAVNNSRRKINSLLDINPDTARIKLGDETVQVTSSDIKIGDEIIVFAGDKIPVDGIILSGISTLNTAPLTGESLPLSAAEGDKVLSGYINLSGVLTIRATQVASSSAAAKILDLIENVTEKKSKTENFITRFAKIYTPLVILLALFIWIIPTFCLGKPSLFWLKQALTLLVISCPCAVVISVPLCYFAGIGKASSEGILIKGGNYLDNLSKADSFIFDKTGTLTTGEFTVKDIVSYGELSQEEILYYIAMAECYSTHPIAVSILKAYKGDIDKKKILGYKELSGMGISCTIDGKKILAGNRKLFENTEISGSDMTTVYLSIDGVPEGHITLGDTVRNGAETLISSLNNVYMLTGDNKKTAEKTAEKLGIKNVFAELLPPDKVEKVEEISKNSKATVFVGDGINDAPSLVGADVGIVMGGVGSDAAIEAADVVIMNDDLGKISVAVKISRFTRKIMLQCISVSLGIKFLIMLLAVSGFSNMYFAIFADVGVCLLAILNSLRILKI